MAIQVPQINMEFSGQFSEEAPRAVKFIRKNYGNIVRDASADIGIDPNFIIGFMVIESAKMDGSGQVNPRATSPAGAKGLMQLTPETAFDAIEKQAPVMSNKQVTIVNKYLPGLVKAGGFTGFYKNYKDKLSNVLFEPEFSIWIGAMLKAQICKYVINNSGSLNLAQVVVIYNAGEGNYKKWVVNNNLSKSDSTTLVKGLQVAGGLKESRQYIVKLLGINGSLVAAIKNPTA